MLCLAILKGKIILCKAFSYKKYDFNPTTGVLSLYYTLDTYSFCEKITFPHAPFSLNENQKKALDNIFFLTHIALGISYYKTFCPEKLEILSGTLTQDEALFFNKFYLEGLGEFAVRNGLNLQNKIHFPFKQNFKREILHFELDKKFLIPIGGGKDSCVTLELLKRTQQDLTAISVGTAKPIQECIQKADVPSLLITRKIDKKLLELNQEGKVYNGHVPITGLLAFLLWASAVLYNYKYIAMSTESSANSGNLMQGNLKINHQYSKSYDFEYDFYKICQAITPKFLYFSLLRPLLEIKIGSLFATYCKKYFSVFTSCNKAFKLDKTKRLDRWCGCCDKCRFVFLILAPFMNKEDLIAAVGTNPLNDLSNLDGYKELLGLSGYKPFECVGEVEECQAAFHLLLSKKEYQSDAIIQALKEKVPQPKKDVFSLLDEHLIPQEIYDEISKLIK